VSHSKLGHLFKVDIGLWILGGNLGRRYSLSH